MSRGPGSRQRALLRAVAALPPGAALRVVPEAASHSEQSALRRAAKRLAQTGRARAVYLRTTTVDDRWAGQLHLVPADSSITGDCYPLRSPEWVQVPPPTFTSFSMRLQGLMIGSLTGSPVSAPTISRITAELLRPRTGTAPG